MEVDADVVVIEVGGQYRAVAGEDFAAQGLDEHGVGKGAVALGVPFVGVHHGGVEQEQHAEAGHGEYRHGNDDVAAIDVTAARGGAGGFLSFVAAAQD